MNGSENGRSVLTAKLTCISVLTAALALTLGARAHAQVTSADIVDGQVKAPDIASSAVTSAKIAGSAVTAGKIAGNAVTGIKVQDNSLTGADIQDNTLSGADILDNTLTAADITDNTLTGFDITDNTLTGNDINESTLSGVNASELGGFRANEIVRIGKAGVTSVVDLPDCSPGLAYVTKTITVPYNGSVLVTAMFTAQVSGAIVSKALAARVETNQQGGVVQVGIWAEDHTAYGSPNQRSNLVSTELFGVGAGDNTFVLRVCDSSDADQAAAAIRGQMTFVYTPAAPL